MLGISEITRMEAYDISNTNGFESVGSMVVYERGKPKRNDYRKFKIKGIQGQMTMEVCGKCLRDDSLMDCESGKRVKNWRIYSISGSDPDGWRKRSGQCRTAGTR